MWITLASVVQLGFDSVHGIFADVKFMPTGELETALVGTSYAGNGFGDWAPLHVDDIVLVAVPNGDPNTGPVIIARMWSGADHPSADFKAAQQDNGSDVPTNDRVIRVEPGQKLRLITSGDTGEIDITVEGNTNVNLTAGALVKMQDGSQAYVRGNDYANSLSDFLTALNTMQSALAAYATALGTGTPTNPVLHSEAATAASTLATAIAQFGISISIFQDAHTTYLSTKVKGQ